MFSPVDIALFKLYNITMNNGAEFKKLNKCVYLYVFTFSLFICLFSFKPLIASSTQDKLPVLNREFSDKAYLVISGTIINREEIWDRRTNPLMGRPDILKEIIWEVRIDSFLKRKSPVASGSIKISITGEKLIIKHKAITAGSKGIFYLTGVRQPYALIYADIPAIDSINPAPVKTIKPRPKPKATTTPYGGPLLESEKISGRDIIKSKELQDKAVREIAKKYNMKNPSFLSMTSFSGPVPPNGGYKYWGVKGDIKGVAHVWQHGYGLRQGSSLEDPQRYNKCNSPGTKISTPLGPAAIEDLKAGDLVFSFGNLPVPILEISKVRAVNHKVCRLVFDDGSTLDISPLHPLPDGRQIGSLTAGDTICGKKIAKSGLIPYKHDYTYDILPASVSGTYFANGICVGSTLKR